MWPRSSGAPRTFVTLARRGELPTVRIGGRYVCFHTDALERLSIATMARAHEGLYREIAVDHGLLKRW
jgi:hypothetical protein